MADHALEKEKRRKKQNKRMGKMLAKVWEMKQSEPFQEEVNAQSTVENVLDLTTIGQKVDGDGYRLGRHGWEDFARDIGGVYNRHIHRKTKHARTARTHLGKVKDLLEHVDHSLSILASEHIPKEAEKKSSSEKTSKKRKLDDTPNGSKKKQAAQRSKNGEGLTIGEREERAMEALATFVEEKGGSREQVKSFRARVTRKPSDGRYDTNYYNPQGRRFRSMLDVGRVLGLVKKNKPARKGFKKNPTSREQEAEKKKLRKELDRLRKAHGRATKALDDFLTDEKESRYPIEDLLLMEETESKQSSLAAITPLTCAGARAPDISEFPDIPGHCIPDLVMVWDFLCTFQRPLNLNPIDFHDFVSALTFQPDHAGLLASDEHFDQPVYLAEAHLGLLKLLLQDDSSDLWWWSILETNETENPHDDFADALKEEETLPPVKIDIAALLAEPEDSLITTSWLQTLDEIRSVGTSKSSAIKGIVKTALAVVSNKWVSAYLKKALVKQKSKGTEFTKAAVVWLIDRVRDARPDLYGRNVHKNEVYTQRAKVVEEVSQQMEKLDTSIPTVTEEDLVSDAESDDDEDDSSCDSEDGADKTEEAYAKGDVEVEAQEDLDARTASAIPTKPPPSIVDLLLPPAKPKPPSDLINPFSWPQLAGASACRIVHRYKRLRNEVDDSLRKSHELPRLTVAERRAREAVSTSRVLSECMVDHEGKNPSEEAIEHLCTGGNYLSLNPLQRLCILKLLVEAAYDTSRVHDVVDGNFKQRISAVKALETEERRAKREAREKAAADESAARQQLAAEARNAFLDEKREQIKKLNESSEEYTEEYIDSLADEDIIDFDEDIKADFDTLPAPESFNKTEVKGMIVRMKEEAAFETRALRVLNYEELLVRERKSFEEMKSELISFGGVEALDDPSLDRETKRSVERLRREIEKAENLGETLPELREVAMEALRDAMADGTMKALKSAIRMAKTAKLTGPDEENGGVWAVDILRDAAVELENAKQRKRVIDAQKALIAKRNKCFIRNNPLGRDRFRNSFWHFDNDEQGHVWVEANYVPRHSSSNMANSAPGFLDLAVDPSSLSIGPPESEEDLLRLDGTNEASDFLHFSRREYHSSGIISATARRRWGCHVTEESLRGVIKKLDQRGVREGELRTRLKEAVEENVTGSGEKAERSKVESNSKDPPPHQAEGTVYEGEGVQRSGDEDSFSAVKATLYQTPPEWLSTEIIDGLCSGIGERVRIRRIIDDSKDPPVVRYEMATVTGWMIEPMEADVGQTENEFFETGDSASGEKASGVPVWRAMSDNGHLIWLSGEDLLESICRLARWTKKDPSYHEKDVAFLVYRNSLGRHCGKASEALDSCSPNVFARFMVRREQELYTRLKSRNYDNSWGGKNGARVLWISSMKDYTFDFATAQQGLKTLEDAFFELTGGFSDRMEAAEYPSAKNLLDDPSSRFELELESIESSENGLWNSRSSRAVYLEIVASCRTFGVLSLALELLCRNTRAYLDANKIYEQRPATVAAPTARVTRRMNAWQQAHQSGWG